MLGEHQQALALVAGVGGGGHARVRVRVATARGRVFAARGELLACVLAHRLEQGEPRWLGGVAVDERAFHQVRQRVDDRVAAVGGDFRTVGPGARAALRGVRHRGLGRDLHEQGEREAAAEHAADAEQPLLGGRKQAVAPVERRM